MRYVGPVVLLLSLCVVLLPAPRAVAQWHDGTHPIGLTPPEGWPAMSDRLVVEVNRTVRHVSPGLFQAGYQAHEGEVLFFPYLLVQYVPYTDLPEAHRPTYRLDEADALQLIGRLVKQFRADDPLPEGMSADGFAQAYDQTTVRLVDVYGDGGFALAGTIPLQDGGQLGYHTFGRIGRDGVAFVSVFTNEGMDSVEHVIERTLESLVFDAGQGFADLPEREPEVAGFLPPPAEPLPSGALLGGGQAFGFVSAQGYVPLSAGAFDPREKQVLSALPEALQGVTLGHVLTRTPTSRRITRPWGASAYAPLDTFGWGGALERRPTIAQWAGLLSALVGVEPAVAQLQLERLVADPGAGVAMSGGGAEGSTPWRVETVEMEAGRVVLSRRVTDAVDATLQTRIDLTLVVGREGVAVLVSESYTDAPEAEVDELAAMQSSLRMVGGQRLVDVPPVGEGDGSEVEGTVEQPDEQGADTIAPGDAGQPDAPASAAVTAQNDLPKPVAPSGSPLALPLVLGGLAVVFIGIVVAVVVTSHAKAKRQREKVRARRERGRAPR